MSERSQHTPGMHARRQLRPVGPPGANMFTWITRAAALALLLSVLWLLWVSVRPLSTPITSSNGQPPPIPEFAWKEPPDNDGQAALTELSQSHIFDDARRPWSQRVAIGPDESASPNEASTSVDSQSAPIPPPIIGQLTVDPVESLPEDVKTALAALSLRGIRLTRSGELVALISLVHTQNPFNFKEYGVGDQFKDDKFPKADWRVLGIEPQTDRVVLERAGKRVSLSLYSSEFASVASKSPSSSAAASEHSARMPKTITTRTREEVRDELKKADISDEQIAELMKLLDEQPADPATVAASAPGADGANTSAQGPAPNEAMAALLRSMLTGKPPTADPAPTSTAEKKPGG